MSKSKSFAEQIEELQATSEKVVGYEKLFSKACEMNFGCNAKTIKNIRRGPSRHGRLRNRPRA